MVDEAPTRVEDHSWEGGVKDIEAHFRYLAWEDRELELRVIDPRFPGLKNQRFVKTVQEFVAVCCEYDGTCNVCVGINPRRPRGTRDVDVIAYRTFVVDFDSDRADHSLVPSTDEERLRAIEQAWGYREWCEKRGFIPPVLCMSGNGTHAYHAIPPIDLSQQDCKQVAARIRAYLAKIESPWRARVAYLRRTCIYCNSFRLTRDLRLL